MRISSFDLDLLKKRAQKEGMPYQTLINAILHKYVTNQLLEKDEAIKTLRLMQ
jgi:predicted DNA binding CopG/RHH family protein